MTKASKISTQYNYATLNRKIIAFGIDIVIITFVLSPIMNLLTMILFGFDNNSFIEFDKNLQQAQNMSFTSIFDSLLITVSNLRYIFMQFIMLCCVTLYFLFFWAKMGASIGKLIMQCKILDADSYKPINMKQSIKRMIGHIFNLLTLGIGLFMADYTKRKQGLHDKFANTIVVVRKKDR